MIGPTFTDVQATAAVDDSPRLRELPTWIAAGQVGVIVTIVLGFGAYQPVKPMLFTAMLMLCLVAMLLLGPVGHLSRVVVSAPVVAWVVWWMASSGWTYNDWGWERETKLHIPMLFAGVAFASLLPYRAFTRALVVGCYAAIGWTVLSTLMHPAESMRNPDGVSGWHGGFLHKNYMAPFMVFAVITLACFDRRGPVRRVTITISVFFIVMSQSTTVLAVALVLIPAWWLLGRIAGSDQRSRSVLVLVSSIGGVLAGFVIVNFMPLLLEFRGKDPTLSRRTEIWGRVWDAIFERPFTGYGVGGVWVNPGVDPTRTILRGLGFTVFHAHNGYLEIALQLGVIGLAIFLFLAVATLRTGLRLLSHNSALARHLILYVLLVAFASYAEVLTMGVWLTMLCALYVVGMRASAQVVPSSPPMQLAATSQWRSN